MKDGHLIHAIVGCGRVAPSHADAFSRLDDVKIKYACDIRPDVAREFQTRYPEIQRATASLEEILGDPEVDSLSLATPHDLHYSMARQAREAGKHVLIEKPFGRNTEEAFGLAALAREPGPIVQPVAQHRYDPLVQLLAGAVLDGALGQLHLVRGHLECFRPPEYYGESDWRGRWEREGGSVLINQAYHVLDMMLWLAGPVATVSAEMDTVSYKSVMETEDTLTASFKLDQGGLGGLTISGSAGSQWNSYIECVGDKGVVAFDIGYPNALHRLQLEDRKLGFQLRKAIKGLADSQEAPPSALGYYGTSHRRQCADLVTRIRGGEGDSMGSTPDQAARVVATITALYDAARQGVRVKVGGG